MKKNITQTIISCKACQEGRPSKAANTMTPRAPSSAEQPMEEVATDLYNVSGKDWLVMVNHFSGYTWTHQLQRASTREVTDKLKAWFLKFGWPRIVRSDSGPQF